MEPELEETKLGPLTAAKLHELAAPTLERLEKWRMFCAKWTLNTTYFDGRTVSYEGVSYCGSPRDVFWGRFFEPFLENTASELLRWVVSECTTRELEPTTYVAEALLLLKGHVERAYNEMASTDYLLRKASGEKGISLDRKSVV